MPIGLSVRSRRRKRGTHPPILVLGGVVITAAAFLLSAATRNSSLLASGLVRAAGAGSGSGFVGTGLGEPSGARPTTFLPPSGGRRSPVGGMGPPRGGAVTSSATRVASAAAATLEGMDVAVIGGGAAGLAAARVLTRGGIGNVTVFEKGPDIGGVWRYSPNDRERPMYRGLRTNLPREIMAFREKPWGGDREGLRYVHVGLHGSLCLFDTSYCLPEPVGDLASPVEDNDDCRFIPNHRGASFVTHRDVQEYLSDYARQFHLLERNVKFNCQVTQLTVENENSSDVSLASPSRRRGDGEVWPKVCLTWSEGGKGAIENESSAASQQRSRSFDAVCVCNGHYATPSPPTIPGLAENFRGRVMHSIEYDDPSVFAGKVVLCVGGRASGSDVAREVSAVADRVYLSDSGCPPMEAAEDGGERKPRQFGNVTWLPRTDSVTESRIQFGDGAWSVPVEEVDVVMFCSGYDYSFPFINDKSNLELRCVPGERRVAPLYEQLWHAQYPGLAFIGLQHSIVPFPFFELQAEAFSAQLTGTAPQPLPPLQDRLDAAERDKLSGGPKSPGRVEDTHYLGGFQWDYCRKMAKMAGIYDTEMEDFIATNKAIYDYAGKERKSLFPGGPDTYRFTKYVRNDAKQAFEVVGKKEERPEGVEAVV